MAIHTIFKPKPEPPFFEEVDLDLGWETVGHSLKDAREKAKSLIAAANGKLGIRVFEISRAASGLATTPTFGEHLSAFKLEAIITKDSWKRLPVEVVYQKAKVWEGDEESLPDLSLISLYGVIGSKIAKSEAAQKRTALKQFSIRIGNQTRNFPIDPPDAFYNWLYLTALRHQHNKILYDRLIEEIRKQDLGRIGFSDIFFTKQSETRTRYACQARTIAILAGLDRTHENELDILFPRNQSLEEYITDEELLKRSFEGFIKLVYGIEMNE